MPLDIFPHLSSGDNYANSCPQLTVKAKSECILYKEVHFIQGRKTLSSSYILSKWQFRHHYSSVFSCCCCCFFFFVFLPFLGPLLRHIEIPRLGVQSELQLPAYARATATQDPSRVCDLHHSSQQHRILNPLGKARDRTCVPMDSSQIHFRCATT